MKTITYFHRNIKAGYSINKVTQTVISHIDNKREYYMPTHRASFGDLIKNILYIFKHRDKNGINHITGDIHYGILGLIGCKSVLTVHDTDKVDFAKCGWLKKKIYELLWFKIPCALASKIVCISNETKEMLCKYTKRKDIQVIYNAIDPSFTTVLKKQDLSNIKILMIGTAENKNIERTLEALKDIDCQVTIVGKMTASQKMLVQKSGIVLDNKYNLSDHEIREEYINCDIVSFVSLFEGFGMPIVEANITGRPVITSNISVLKEIAGNAALYVDPTNIKDINNGFKQLTKSPKLRNFYVEEGLKNACRFEHNAIIQEWLNLYKTL